MHRNLMQQESAGTKALIYTGAFFTGLWNAGSDLAVWIKDVNDVVNPAFRLVRSVRTNIKVAARASATGENIAAVYADEHLKAEKKELVEVLGFDPSSITSEQFDKTMEISELIWADPDMQPMLWQFCKDYVSAQHAIELTALSGEAAFEVLLTAILAALTMGASLAVSAGAQARHLRKFQKLGDLFVELGETLKDAQTRMKSRGAKANKGSARQSLYTGGEEVAVGPITRQIENKPTQKEQAKKDTDTNTDDSFDYDSPKNVTYSDFCGTVKDFKDGGPDAEQAYALFKEEKWDELEALFKEKDLNGGWPPNGGAISVNEITLSPPKTVDRYGGWIDEDGKFNDTGAYMADANEPFENRALPKATLDKPYKQYEIVKEIPEVKAGKVIPWFGEPGKGMQYELPMQMDELIELGYVKEITQ